jgi:hypothetical protein
MLHAARCISKPEHGAQPTSEAAGDKRQPTDNQPRRIFSTTWPCRARDGPRRCCRRRCCRCRGRCCFLLLLLLLRLLLLVQPRRRPSCSHTLPMSLRPDDRSRRSRSKSPGRPHSTSRSHSRSHSHSRVRDPGPRQHYDHGHPYDVDYAAVERAPEPAYAHDYSQPGQPYYP